MLIRSKRGEHCEKSADGCEGRKMRATIFEIKRFAVHDGDGIRTTVFFKGCPLECVWCHNPEGIKFRPELAFYENKCVSCGYCVSACPKKSHTLQDGYHNYDRMLCTGCGSCEEICPNGALKFYGKEMTVEELLPVLLEDKAFYDTSGGGVTLSGGECLMQADFCRELLATLKKEGIHTAVDTCGFVSGEALRKVMPYTDIFLYDLKAFDEEVHKCCTGHSNQIILKNLKALDDCGKDIEIRIPYVPEYNDDQMEKIAGFLSGLTHITKVRVLAYHNYAGSKYESLGMVNTLPERLPEQYEIETVRELFRGKGLKLGE